MSASQNQFRQQEQQTEQQANRENQQQEATQELVFKTVDDLLKHDRERNAVPAGLAARVNESLSQEPPPPQRWWQKLFGKS